MGVNSKENIVREIPVNLATTDYEDLVNGFFIRSGVGGVIKYLPFGNAESLSASRSVDTNVATIVVPSNHNFKVGRRVIIVGMTDATYDGTYIITAVTANSISFALTHADEAATADAAGIISEAIVKTLDASAVFNDPVLCKKIYKTGTAATDIYCVYGI